LFTDLLGETFLKTFKEATASACDLDKVLSALSNFGKAPDTSPWRSHSTLDNIRLETIIETLLYEAQ
jgi:hypothetical protein